jgi:hypothetical protein
VNGAVFVVPDAAVCVSGDAATGADDNEMEREL